MVTEAFYVSICCFVAHCVAYLGFAGTYFEQTVVETVAVVDYFEQSSGIINTVEIRSGVTRSYCDMVNTV